MSEYRVIFRIVKKYGFVVFVLFLFSFLFGVFFVQVYPQEANKHFSSLVEEFSFLFTLGPAEMLFFIFLNNTVKIFLTMILGIFFAIPTILFLTINGLALGLVSAIAYPEVGLRGLFLLLLPHGIFELSALFIASSFGIWLGVGFWQKIRRGVKGESIRKLLREGSFKKEIKICLKVFFCPIVLLLFLAAIIETVLIFYL